VETLYKCFLLDLGIQTTVKTRSKIDRTSLVSRSSRNTKPSSIPSTEVRRRCVKTNDTIEIYLYIRIDDDDDALRYLQLLKELELDFRSAMTTPAS